MLPTFVIGLREGLEASLIIGIVAAFLRQEGGDAKALRWMWTGVGLAILLCAGVGIGLHVADTELPQREQEMLETVIGFIAVGVVTWMIIWMRGHARTLKSSLQASAATALAAGSVMALIGMAFFAVFREGFETAVFLVAAFNAADNVQSAAGGAVLGVVVASTLGFFVYRGGVKINLQKFFKVTGLVLTFVAAGLFAMAFHTAHEAGWITSMQDQAVDLTWLVQPGTVSAAMLTGMLGLQPRPTQIETIAYLGYLIPMAAYVLWPAGRPPRTAPATAGATA